MINKHTNKKYKFVKGKTYTAKGRANYRIKDYDYSNIDYLRYSGEGKEVVLNA